MADPYVDIRCGDAIEVMAGMAADSVDMVCSSPPYWNLRRYAGQQERVWGGKADCVHEWEAVIAKAQAHKAGETNPGKEGYTKDKGQWPATQGQFCQKCGAWRGSFGLEPSPELYVTHTLEVLRAIRRVLKPWGTVWYNLGDSYAGSNNGSNDYRLLGSSISRSPEKYQGQKPGLSGGLKPLDLCLIPERVVLAAQQDGWYVRSIVVWAKPNPMPESIRGWRWERHQVKVGKSKRGTESWSIETGQGDHKNGQICGSSEYEDCPGCPKCSPNDGLVLRKGSWRPTDAYEQILMLAKSHEYYGDGEEVRETQQMASLLRTTRGWEGDTQRGYPNGPQSHIDRYFNKSLKEALALPGRNLRNVWNFPTQSFSDWGYDFEHADYVGDDGKPYKLSPDCPIHGLHHGKGTQKKGAYDELSNLLENDKDGNAICHVQEPESESVSILDPDVVMKVGDNGDGQIPENTSANKTSSSNMVAPRKSAHTENTQKIPSSRLDYCSQADAQIAIEHNKKTRKMGPVLETNPACIVSEENELHIDGKQVQLSMVGLDAHTSENNNEVDCASNEKVLSPLVETLSHNAHKSYSNSKCTCRISQISHFATFPERLPEICILASTPAAGICSKCGRPWARVIDKDKPPASIYTSSAKPEEINPVGNHLVGMGQKYQNWLDSHPARTLGFRPTCTCKAPSEPALVLDCFSGSGTTGAVAKRLGRKAILIDISPEYCEMARKRVEATPAPMRLEC